MELTDSVGLLYRANHFLKRGLQRISLHAQQARWMQRANGTHAFTEREVCLQLAQRRPKRRKKRRGELEILYVGIGEPTYNSMHIYPTLRQFGNLTVFQPGEHPAQHSASAWRKRKVEINEELLDLLKRRSSPSDILIGQLAGWLVTPVTLQQVKAMGVPIVNYSWDDTAGFYGSRVDGYWSGPAALAAVVDLNLTSCRESCLKYQAEGGLALFWPEAADPQFHRPHEVSLEFDVSFVGARYGYRPLLVEFLRKQGIQVVTFGPGWSGGMLSSEEMVRLYSKSRINLGFGGIGHMVMVQHLKGRDFEVPMSGGFYLTSYHRDLDECYKIGKEIVCYRDKWDCLEKIRYFLNHSEEAEAIRKAGRQRALRDHTWERRIAQLLGWVGLLE